MRRSDRGGVTVEAALALPALVLVLGMMLWAVAAVTGQLRCVDAARSAARALARGESISAAITAAHRLAPPAADVRVDMDGEFVRVDVSARVAALGLAGDLLPDMTVSGDAVVAVEQP